MCACGGVWVNVGICVCQTWWNSAMLYSYEQKMPACVFAYACVLAYACVRVCVHVRVHTSAIMFVSFFVIKASQLRRQQKRTLYDKYTECVMCCQNSL